MTPNEIQAQAERRLAEGANDMCLTVSRSREPRETVRLFCNAGPKGRVVGTTDNGDGRVRVIAFFECADVLRWMAERGLITASGRSSSE